MKARDKNRQKRRAGRPPRGPLDKVRTILWFWAIANKLGVNSAYAVEKFYFENTNNKGGHFTSTGKFNKYKNGKHVPSEDVVRWFEKKFRGTRTWLDHPFWKVALPSIEIEELYENLSNLRSGVSDVLFYPRQKGLRPIRRDVGSTDALIELDIESDWDALAACFGLIHEAEHFERNSDLSLLRLITLQVMSRATSRFPTLKIMPELFTHLRQYFLDETGNDEWLKRLDSVSFADCKIINNFILELIDDLHILKYFKNPPLRCLFYGQHYLDSNTINQLWNYQFEGGAKKIRKHPSIHGLTTNLRKWERDCLRNNSIKNYPELRQRPVNHGSLVNV